MTESFAAFDVVDYLDDDMVIAEYLHAAAEYANPMVLRAALADVARVREAKRKR